MAGTYSSIPLENRSSELSSHSRCGCLYLESEHWSVAYNIAFRLSEKTQWWHEDFRSVTFHFVLLRHSQYSSIPKKQETHHRCMTNAMNTNYPCYRSLQLCTVNCALDRVFISKTERKQWRSPRCVSVHHFKVQAGVKKQGDKKINWSDQCVFFLSMLLSFPTLCLQPMPIPSLGAFVNHMRKESERAEKIPWAHFWFVPNLSLSTHVLSSATICSKHTQRMPNPPSSRKQPIPAPAAFVLLQFCWRQSRSHLRRSRKHPKLCTSSSIPVWLGTERSWLQ